MLLYVYLSRMRDLRGFSWVDEEISTLDEHSLTENVNSMTKTSPQKFYNKVSKFVANFKRARDSVLLDQNLAYGTNTTAAVAPDIDTETNKAYGYLESQILYFFYQGW